MQPARSDDKSRGRMRRTVVVAVVAVALAACSRSKAPAAPVGRVVGYAPPADTDPALLALPRNDAGVMALTPGVPLGVGWAPPAPGPMTALAACTRWITGCVSPPDRTVDDCARSVPACKTPRPWDEAACCPQACFDRYVAARAAGKTDTDAFTGAYFDRADNCVPGVSAALRSKP